MFESLNKFKGKKVLIWGYGKEGKSTESFFERMNVAEEIKVYEGLYDEKLFSAYDFIFKSPGIVCNVCDERLTSQTELFLSQYRDKTVGITGTKGKSTTSSMLYKVLKENLPVNVVLVGNIGEPCLDHFDTEEEGTIFVFEMSCHQLSDLKVSPHVALFLNLYEEHLDHYKTFESYFNAKRNIAKYQKSTDFLFVGENVPTLDSNAFTKIIYEKDVENIELMIPGRHNQCNALFVLDVARMVFKCDEEKVKNSIKTFKGLEHRLQYIGEFNGIRYYDDSISTIPHATYCAVESIDRVGTILIGGMDRLIDYSELVDLVKKRSDINFVFSYASGKRVYEDVRGLCNCYYEDDLNLAVKKAKEITESGKACILSPASPSYGYFKNFEERGDFFKKLVTEE